ncbi:MAG: hypothetical protein SF029_18695 [bacterium]|nr:hypothetical protein [bacterium]
MRVADIQAEIPAQEYSPVATPAGGISVTAGSLIIALLLVISLVLRVAELGAAPLSENEIGSALAAYRSVFPSAPGDDLVAESPIVFQAQRIAFSLTGGDEATARLLTALAGVGLTLVPLAFGGLLGRTRALMFSVLMTFLPSAMIASRLSSGTIWALLFAGLGLWGVWRFVQQRDQGESGNTFGIIAVMGFAGLIFLAEPGGPLLALILALAAGAALILSALDAPDAVDAPGDDYLRGVIAQFQGFPWQTGLTGAFLLVLLICTGFMLYPAGFSSVGAVLSGFFSGFTQGVEGRPLFFPLISSLFYDTWVWIFGLIAVGLLVRQRHMGFTDRFFIFWVIFAGFAALLYQGAGAAHGLWLSVPLAGLASHLLAEALLPDDTEPLWIGDLMDDEPLQPSNVRWGKWVLALLALAIIVMFALHLQILSRGLLRVGEGDFFGMLSLMWDRTLQFEANSLIWLVLSVAFLFVGYMLAASIWGNRLPAQSIVLGALAFALITGTSIGWNTSVTEAHNPVEPWYIEATAMDADVLRETMLDFSDRQTRGFPRQSIHVMADPDGLVAWELRDFVNAIYITSPAEGRGQQIVLLPESVTEPNLGSNYVGQRLELTRTWGGTLPGFDFLPWWATRRVRFQPIPGQVYNLWVRQDVFDGQPVPNP